MANRFAVASGNFNDTATWSTTATGSGGASVPVAGDNAISNNFTVTITANATCDNITNGTTYGGTAGGGFVLSNGITLTVLASVLTGGTGGTLRLSGTNSATVAAVSITSVNVNNTDCILHSGTGTLTVNCTTVQSGGLSANASRCINVTAAGILNLTASTITGASETVGTTGAILGGASSTITINAALLTGGTAQSSPAVNANGGICSITGNLLATTSCHAVTVTSTTTLTVLGNVTAANGRNAISGTPNNAIRVSGSFIYSSDGTPPTIQKLILNTTPTLAFTRYALNGTGTYVNMFTADNAPLGPATGDVRAGVVYGSATGTCAVPAAGSVALGVPVDATTGTAVLTAADVQSALTAQGLTTARAGNLDNLDTTVSSRLAPNGTLATVTTLTNAPDVPTEGEIASAVWSAASREITGGTVDTLTNAPASVTPSDIWSHATRTITGGTVDTLTNAPTVPSAASIRAELDSNSTQLAAIKAKTDNLPASPAATGDIPSANITAIKAKTDLLQTDRLAQCSTVATTGAQLAAALS